MRSPHFSRGRQIACCAAIVLLALLMFAGFSRWLREREVTSPIGPDNDDRSNLPAAIEANNFGIALLEQHRYLDAVAEFEKAVQLAPDWLPGRINLGIALLNAGGIDEDSSRRTRTIFEEILNREPDNPNAHFCMGILLRNQQNRGEDARRKHFEAVLHKDPDDAYSWYWLAALQPMLSEDQVRCYREALKRDRHLGGLCTIWR
jgi:tetratricopeptide (TPR) repeat protein